MECYKFKLVDPTEVFVDATHVKARANNKKMQKRIAHEEALFYEELLKKEINEDRELHGRKPLKEKPDKDNDDNDNTAPPVSGGGMESPFDDKKKTEKTIKYSTTNRDGYREYKSCGSTCADCPHLKQCTESKDHVKTVTRHIWEPYMEICEDIRHTLGMQELYGKRKETIERLFGTAKENHGFRYTQMYGKARMEMKVGLTFACMNLKKLAKIKQKRGLLDRLMDYFVAKMDANKYCYRKTAIGLAS